MSTVPAWTVAEVALLFAKIRLLVVAGALAETVSAPTVMFAVLAPPVSPRIMTEPVLPLGNETWPLALSVPRLTAFALITFAFAPQRPERLQYFLPGCYCYPAPPVLLPTVEAGGRNRIAGIRQQHFASGACSRCAPTLNAPVVVVNEKFASPLRSTVGTVLPALLLLEVTPT